MCRFTDSLVPPPDVPEPAYKRWFYKKQTDGEDDHITTVYPEYLLCISLINTSEHSGFTC